MNWDASALETPTMQRDRTHSLSNARHASETNDVFPKGTLSTKLEHTTFKAVPG